MSRRTLGSRESGPRRIASRRFDAMSAAARADWERGRLARIFTNAGGTPALPGTPSA